MIYVESSRRTKSQSAYNIFKEIIERFLFKHSRVLFREIVYICVFPNVSNLWKLQEVMRVIEAPRTLSFHKFHRPNV